MIRNRTVNPVIRIVHIFIAYSQGVDVQFISLQSTSGVCSFVTKPVSGTFLASIQGLWQGAVGFQYTLALYSVELNNLAVDEDQYENLVSSLAFSLTDGFGAATAVNNLAINLIILMAGIISTNVNDNLQVIQFTGNPSIVFNRQTLESYLVMRTDVNHTFQCDATTNTVFDTSTATFILQYNYEQFINYDCQAALAPFTVQTSDQVITSFSQFSVSIDMRSFVTAFAVNVGILDTNFLEPILPSSTISLNELFFTCDDHGEFTVRQVYDTRYPNMKPIMCIYTSHYPTDDNSDNEKFVFCLLEIGYGFWLPVFNHDGNSYTEPSYCDW